MYVYCGGWTTKREEKKYPVVLTMLFGIAPTDFTHTHTHTDDKMGSLSFRQTLLLHVHAGTIAIDSMTQNQSVQ